MIEVVRQAEAGDGGSRILGAVSVPRVDGSVHQWLLKENGELVPRLQGDV